MDEMEKTLNKEFPNAITIKGLFDKIDSAIDNIFGNKTVQKLKDNIVLKEDFLAKYKKLYKGTLNKILKGIKNEPKQK